MTIPFETWRAQVDKDLAGKSFDKILVQQTLEGIAVDPLFVAAPELPQLTGTGDPVRICMHHASFASDQILADVEGGADAIWSVTAATPYPTGVFVLADAQTPRDPAPANGVLCFDALAHGSSATELAEASKRADLAPLVSTLAHHDAGADAVDEIAFALAGLTQWLGAFDSVADAQRMVLRVAVGRDTFLELCKLRALRLTWRKVLAACGAPAAPPPLLHAVCSARTLTARDPWVNLLRVTTQTFAAVLGSADLVTPAPFDQLLESPSALGRRIARNTGLVLRDESSLGRVVDPGSGSYYLDSLTDALARKAWQRFVAIEAGGGITRALEGDPFAPTRQARQAAIAQRKLSILGVSEFANLGETLPSAPRVDADPRRDAAAFEALRAAAHVEPALLLALGPALESRARVGFAASFFAAGGLGSRESNAAEPSAVACICGSDERYASEAVAAARALKAAGCRRVLLAGRPGALEAELRAAGVDDFVFVGSDVVRILGSLLESP